MAGNIFAQDPVSHLLSSQMGARPTRPGQQATPTAPTATGPGRTLEDAFGEIATTTQVPVNLLLALEEASPAGDPNAAVQRAQQSAARLQALIAAGKPIEQALAEEIGDPQQAQRLLNRAYDLADMLYPRDPGKENSRAEDLARSFGGSIVRAVGGGVEAVGRAIDQMNPVEQVARLTGLREPGEDGLGARGFKAAGDVVRGVGENIRDGISLDAQKAIEESTPGGSILEPSTWTLGENPSLKGYSLLAADVLGSFAPVVAASLAGGPAAGAAVGGAIGGGAGAETARSIVQAAAQDIGEDGVSRLERESSYYRSLIQGGMDPAEALARTEEAASQLAFLFTTPISAFGGAATGKILTQPAGAIARQNLAGRVVGTAALSGAEEGVQEVAESLAARMGTQTATGLDVDMMEGTFGDFLLGAMGGAPVGALAGAASRREGVQPPQLDPNQEIPGADGSGAGAAVPPGPTVPGPGGAATEPAADPLARPPMGPLSAAAAKAPPPGPMPPGLFPDMKPGTDVKLMTPDGALLDAVFLAETPTGVQVRVGGQPYEITAAEFDDARTKALRAEEDGIDSQGQTGDTGAGASAPVSSGGAAPASTPGTPPLPQAPQTPGAIATPPQQPGAVDAVPPPSPPVDMDQQGEGGATGQRPGMDLPATPEEGSVDPSAMWNGADAAAREAMLKRAGGFQTSAGKLTAPAKKALTQPWDQLGEAIRRQITAIEEQSAKTRAENARREAEIDSLIEAMKDEDGAARDAAINLGYERALRFAARDGNMAEFRQKIGLVEATEGDPQWPLPNENMVYDKEAVKPENRLRAEVKGRKFAEIDTLEVAPGKWLASFDYELAESGGGRGLSAGTIYDSRDAAVAGALVEARKSLGGKRADSADAKPAAALLREIEKLAGVTPTTPTPTPTPPQEVGEAPKDNEGQKPGQKAGEGPVETPPAEPAGAAPDIVRAIEATGRVPQGFKVVLDGDVFGFTAPGSDQFYPYGRTFMAERNPAEHARDVENMLARMEAMNTGVNNPAPESENEPQGPETPEPSAVPTPEEVAAAAAEADPNPTPAQAEAGNYKKGHLSWNGLDLTIETAKGSERRGIAQDGTEWSVTMPAEYGYIKRTEGADGDQVDFYMGENPDSESVWIVDQVDADTKAFDEHKAILGVKNKRAALKIYHEGFSDGRAKDRIGGVTEMTVEAFKEWLANGDMTAPAAAPKEGRKGKQKDFGEEISGTRKGSAKKWSDDLGADIDAQGMSLSEAFPQPDYDALIANGTPKENAAAIAIVRAAIPRKPVKSWDIPGWARTVDRARALAKRLTENDLEDGDTVAAQLQATAVKADAWELRLQDPDIAMIEVMRKMKPEDFGPAAADFRVRIDTVWTRDDGALYRWEIQKRRTGGFWRSVGVSENFPNREGVPAITKAPAVMDQVSQVTGEAPGMKMDAYAALRVAELVAHDREKRKGRQAAGEIEFEIRRWRSGQAQIFVKKPKLLAVGPIFPNSEAAKAYLEENREALEEEVQRLREGPKERPDTPNRTRKGPKWRKGDATEAMFLNDLGFRGVTFGNYLTAKDRQDRMNDTYDAMMDLAGVLGLPVKALSLNGRLGIGFGTHGKGGRGHWAAVYIASTDASQDQVIALTKNSGAGSLAHEWWHAVDNFLAREDAKAGGPPALMTGDKAERRREFMSDRPSSSGLSPDTIQAFRELRTALVQSKWKQRMDKVDQWRGKPYFGTVIELAARGFERMVVDELYKRDMTNDFLAAIWLEGGAYLTMREMRRSGIGAAFDGALEAIKKELGLEGQEGPKLPDVIEDRIDRAPKVDDTWESPDGWRQITDYDDATRQFTVKDMWSGKERQIGVDQVEDIMERDAYLLTEEGQAELERDRIEKEAREKADEAVKAAREKSKDRDAEIAKARRDIKDRTPEILAAYARAAGKRLDPITEKLAKQFNFTDGVFTRAQKIVQIVEQGGKVSGTGLWRPNGTGHDQATFTKVGMDFATWYQRQWAEQERVRQAAQEAQEAEAEAEAAPEDNLSDDALDAALDAALAAAAGKPDLSDDALDAALDAAVGDALGGADAEQAAEPARASRTPKDFGYRVDNPGGSWLAGKIKAAEEDMAKATTPAGKRLPRGSITATMGAGKNPMFLPVEWLTGLPALSGENRRPGESNYDDLRKIVDEEGFDPDQAGNRIVVAVNHLGRGYIMEGNTRLAVARDIGLDRVKVEVRWWNGGEAVEGPVDVRADAIAAIARADAPPRTKPATAPGPRTAGQAAASAAQNIAGGTGDALDGLFNLFGGDDTLSSGFTFSRETYEKAKPLFAAAMRQYARAGADIAEAMNAIVKALVDRFGPEKVRPVIENMRPYIREYVRDVQTGAVDPFADAEPASEAAPEPTPEPQDTEADQERRRITQAFLAAFKEKQRFPTIVAARKFAGEAIGRDIEIGDYTMLEEAIEAAVVLRSREIASLGRYIGDNGVMNISREGAASSVFDRLLELYDSQPILGERTPDKILNQAYSTPAPLAYVASRLAGIGPDTRVVEPTAGNGMLVMEAMPGNVQANELQPTRAAQLRDVLGPEATVTTEDATGATFAPFDVLIANPPFGKVTDQDAGMRRKEWPLGATTTKEIDHAISWAMLEQMPDDGRAVLILGGVKKQLTGEDRKKAYQERSKNFFFKQVYDTYNVVDHFTVSGDLYRKQGAAWPVDVIVIDGRAPSARDYPMKTPPEVLSTWAEVGRKLNDAPDVDTTGRGSGRGDDLSVGTDGPDVGGLRQPGAGPRDEAGTDSTTGGSGPSVGGGVRGPRTGGDGTGTGGRGPRGGQRGPDGGDLGGQVGVPGSNVAGGRDGGAGIDGRPDDARGPADGDVSRPAVTRENTEAETEFQVRYTPRSAARFAVGTLVPKAMQQSANRALDKIEQEHGDIDAFVAGELGYTIEELLGSDEKDGYFSAEQVDALAMAITQVKDGKGFIIGDQTGVGKGRFVAAMLRYAARQGKIPVFVTQKPGLYADMVRDLRDIGMDNALDQIIATNNSLASIPITGPKDTFPGANAKQLKALFSALREGKLPKGKKFLFTTYTQMQTVKGAWPERATALLGAAPNVMLVLDESHEAGGSANKSGFGGPRTPGEAPRDRSEFFRDLVQASSGTVFSSATYAKNPSVMSLYSSTNLALTVENIDNLGPALEKGGVPLLQVVANQITEDGQYLRRERSFDGVSVTMSDDIKVNREHAVEISDAIGKMGLFDAETMEQIRTDFVARIVEDGFVGVKDNSVGVSSAGQSGFASTLHNLVSQFLLTVKLDAVVDKAIEVWKSGEKPVLTLMNVNTSIIQDFISDNGLKIGEEANIPFSAIVERYLERLRMVSVEATNGDKMRIRIPDDFIGAAALAEFEALRKRIRDLKIDGLTGSPVDAIKDKLRAAGMKVDEITGRQTVIDNGILASRKHSPAESKRLMNDFNSGAMDALILSASGSTGFSLHAMDPVKTKGRNDGVKRHMIVLQPHHDINVFMQTLGRVHRTGQIQLPNYTIAVSDLSLEKRQAAVLMKKLASLNANTTAGKKSAFSLEKVVDFVNEVGDSVMLDYLRQDDYLTMRLGLEERVSAGTKEDLAKIATGRFAYLHPDEVDQHYEAIEVAFLTKIEELEQAGTNPLEAKTLDFQARTITSTVLREGTGSGSALDADLTMNLFSVRRLGVPYKSEKVRELVERGLGGMTPEAWKADVKAALEAQMPGHIAGLQSLLNKRKDAWEAAKTARDEGKLSMDAASEKLEASKGRQIGRYTDGKPIRVGDRVKHFGVGEGTVSYAGKFPDNSGRETDRIFVQLDYALNGGDRQFPGLAVSLTLIEAVQVTKEEEAAIVAADKEYSAAKRNYEKLARQVVEASTGVDAVEDRIKGEAVKLSNIVIAAQGVVPGAAFRIRTNSLEDVPAIVISTDVTKTNGNPTAAGRIRIRFAVADAAREVNFTLSQIMDQSPERSISPMLRGFDPMPYFDAGQSQSREERFVATGNLIAGFETFKDSNGQVIFYTTEDGETKPGILMPKNFDMARELGDRPVKFADAAQAAQFIRENNGLLESEDGLLKITQNGWRSFKVEINKAKGKPYFLLKAVQDLWVNPRDGKGRSYTAEVNTSNLAAFLDAYVQNLGTTFLTKAFKDEARLITGEVLPQISGDGASRFRVDTAASQRPLDKRGKTLLARELSQRLKETGLRGSVALQFAESIITPAGDRALGEYRVREGVIRIAMDAANEAMDTLNHEIIHALRDDQRWGSKFGLFTREEWVALVAAARKDKELMARLEEAYPDASMSLLTEEAIAEMYAEWRAGRSKRGLGAIFQKIAAFFDAMGSFFRGKGFVSAEHVMRAIDAGRVGARARDEGGRFAAAPEATEDARPLMFRVARKPNDIIPGSAHWKKGATYFGDLVTDAMHGDLGLLALVPGRALFAELGKRISSAQKYLRLKEDMDALRQEWFAKTDEIAQEWIGHVTADARTNEKGLRKLAPRSGASKANEALMDLMHRATLAGVDPSRDLPLPDKYMDAVRALERRRSKASVEWAENLLASHQKREETHRILRDEFMALPTQFQAIFRKTSRAYNEMGKAFEDALIDNVRISMDISQKRAERDYARAERDAKDDGLKGDELAEKLAPAKAKLDAARAANTWSREGRIANMRLMFETNRLKGPYFPLARFGKYFVTLRDAEGKVVSFSRFENRRAQRGYIEEQEALGENTVEHGVITDSDAIKAQVDPQFVAEVQKIVGEAGGDLALMDAIYQRWLETMPDASVRTNRIHRKGRAGFSRDAFRAFGHHMFHGAHQLARLRYGLKMTDALNDAEMEARASMDPVRAGLAVEEMKKRHDFTMNPTGGPLAANMTALAFIWYLGVSPAAAIVNVTQTTVVGTGILSAAFPKQGVTGTTSELGSALRDFGDGRAFIERSKRLTQDETAAIQEAYRRGTVDRTQAHDLASVAETGIEYSGARERWMKRISFFFHHTERMNREVTFLAAYRMARKDGMEHEVAIDRAASLTWKIHFDYQNTSRPRLMQGDWMKVLTIFRNYSVNMIWRLFRDSHQALKGATVAERREARAQLIGITLAMMAHAGITGVWGWGILMTLLSLFFPGDDEDMEARIQDMLLMEGDSMGTAAWNYTMGLALKGVPGHTLQLNLSERIGMPNLWFRGSDRDLEGQDLYNHWVGEVLGPIGGLAGSFVRGAQTMGEGDWWRGAEALVPKFVRDASRAVRYSAEGVVTRGGDPILEDVSPFQIAWQASGFVPAEVAERYAANSRMRNAEQRILAERRSIQAEVRDIIIAGRTIPEGTLRKLYDFNARFPEYPITGRTIRQSVASRVNASERNEFGIALNPRLNERIRRENGTLLYN